jgi:hypothetical protein
MPVSADMQDHPLITITSDRLIGSQPLCFEVLNAGITWQSREVRAFGLDTRQHAGAGQQDHLRFRTGALAGVVACRLVRGHCRTSQGECRFPTAGAPAGSGQYFWKVHKAPRAGPTVSAILATRSNRFRRAGRGVARGLSATRRESYFVPAIHLANVIP